MDDVAWAASNLRASAEASARAADSSASLQEQQAFSLHQACPGLQCSIKEQAVCTAATALHWLDGGHVTPIGICQGFGGSDVTEEHSSSLGTEDCPRLLTRQQGAHQSGLQASRPGL